ncbi:MAG: hypothetical protein JOZ94_04245 [Xanthobacteraceae bacterium]|nr:hypothetical protein [Xanthobacteraceae bacterium]MBV9627071.1 hypothetical protein [Xanthobacteraceae bacterium]
MSAETRPHHDFPSPEVANRAVMATAAGLMTMMLAGVFLMAGIYAWQMPDRRLPAPQRLPDPQVRTDERLLRQQLEAAQTERLSGYHWENQQKTLIGVPIERAMELLVARGAAAYDPIIPQSNTTAQSPGAATAAAMQGQGSSVPSNGQAPERPQ